MAAKEDAFHQAFRKPVERVAESMRAVGLGLAAVFLLVVGLAFYFKARDEIYMAAWESFETARGGDELLEVAEGYPGTRAAEIALLQAGGILFEEATMPVGEDSSAEERKERKKKLHKALDAFETLARQYPDSYFTGFALEGAAQVSEELGDRQQAIEYFTLALDTWPVNFLTYKWHADIGRNYAALGNIEQARKHLEEAVYSDVMLPPDRGSTEPEEPGWLQAARFQLALLKRPPPEAVPPKEEEKPEAETEVQQTPDTGGEQLEIEAPVTPEEPAEEPEAAAAVEDTAKDQPAGPEEIKE